MRLECAFPHYKGLLSLLSMPMLPPPRPPGCISQMPMPFPHHPLKGRSLWMPPNVSVYCEDMAERHDEVGLGQLRAQLLALQRENERSCAQLAVVQGEAARLRSQLAHQSAFCSSLGAVLGNLVWKASRVPPVVDLLLTGVSLMPCCQLMKS